MIRRGFTFFLFFISTILAYSQVKVTVGASIQSLVQSLAGPGVKIYNIKFNMNYQGNPSFGAFQDDSKSIGLQSGLLLTTGAAILAEGPNNSKGQGQSNTSDYDPYHNKKGTPHPDIDLQKLVEPGIDLYDPCVVEFDIVTTTTNLSFNYVFASEEYNEYTNYNDVFGFFISGPGISGKKNLALIPGTSIPVSVSNLNQDNYPQYFINNDYFNYRTQYDGFTVPLTASIKVQPCVKYHIKLAIQDTRDPIYDSGVFLEKGSFKSDNPAPSLELVYQFPHLNYGIEGCNNAKLIIKRNPLSDLNSNITFPLGTSGTAQTGIDFTLLPNEVTIPAGSAETEIELEIFKDNLAENSETALIFIPDRCPNFPNLASTTLTIKDVFDFHLANERICQNESIILNKNPEPGKSFTWNSSPFLSCLTCNSPTASPDTSTYFKFTVTDDLSQCQAEDSVLVDILFLKADFTIVHDKCYTAQDIALQNNSKYSDQSYWDFGDGTNSTETHPQHFYNIEQGNFPQKYTIRLTVKSNVPACSTDTSKTVEITEGVFTPNLITPNSDRLNDVFKISGIGSECWTLYIFNKWGGLVYKKENYHDNFDAEGIEDGTYFYQLENGPKDKSFKGWVQIIR